MEQPQDEETVIAQFFSTEGEAAGPQLNIPLNTNVGQLHTLLNKLLQNKEEMPYSFYILEDEIIATLKHAIEEQQKGKTQMTKEDVIRIIYQPQAVFRVRSVTRCTGSLEGHTEAVLAASFSPDGTQLATGSGDATLRLWDLDTQTPLFTCKGHKNWVLCVSWSPDGKKIATGGMDKEIRLWDPKTGNQLGGPLTRHTQWINQIQWEPLHLNMNCTRMVSASKDGTARVWDVLRGIPLATLGGHSMSVTCVRWGGEGLIYTGSQDRTIKVWTPEGKLVRALLGHAHWVNTLSLNTDYVLRTGAHDHTGTTYASPEEAQKAALERYRTVSEGKPERMVSGSDDHTLYLWEPSTTKKPITRMTGHQQPINLTSYSPDGRLIASGAFDKSVKLWDGKTGKFLGSLRGHVGSVYQVCWSADSRLLASGSKDSTIKVWSVQTKKMKVELPGHADEVYTVDWSPDGQSVVSGSKDCLVKIWRH